MNKERKYLEEMTRCGTHSVATIKFVNTLLNLDENQGLVKCQVETSHAKHIKELSEQIGRQRKNHILRIAWICLAAFRTKLCGTMSSVALRALPS